MKKILIILVSLLLVLPIGVKAEDTPEKIDIANFNYSYSTYEFIPSMLESISTIYVYNTSSGYVLYPLDLYSTAPFKVFTLDKEVKADMGLSYILQNGYPNQKITGNEETDHFITQMAILHYMIEMDYVGTKDGTYLVGSDTIKNRYQDFVRRYNNSDSEIKSQIDALVQEALNYQKNSISELTIDTSNVSLKLSNDEKYYESNLIKVEKNDAVSYNVSLINASDSVIVTDENNNPKSSFTIDEKFKIRVPANSVNSESIKFKVTVNAQNQKFYIYKTSQVKEPVLMSNNMNVELDDSHVNFVLSKPYGETYEVEKELFLNIDNQDIVTVPSTAATTPLILVIAGVGIMVIALTVVCTILNKKKKVN